MVCKGGTLQCGDTKYFPNAYYKVGDLFLTTNNENPSVRFGGEWELFGKGKTLVCVDDNDSDFSTVKQIGGEKNHFLTINEMPSNIWHSGDNVEGINLLLDPGSNYGIRTLGTNLGKSHNNLQPYITCYIWIRTK